MIKEIKEILLKRVKQEREIEKIKNARTLQDLGLDFKKAVQILDENNIPLRLDEEDKVITQREGEFEGLEDFILVHLTRFAPSGCKIKSPKEANALYREQSVKLDGKEYYYRFPYMRNTVHFTVNNEVNTNHGYLNCDDCKYAVLIPMSDIPKENLKGEGNDMYTINGGPILTSNSYILCLKGESEELRKNNPGVIIIECEGGSIRDYSRAFLSTIGYKQRETGAHSFMDDSVSHKFMEIMKENGIPGPIHSYSEEMKSEEDYLLFNEDLTLYNIIRENNLIQNETDKKRIIDQLQSASKVRGPHDSAWRICNISNDEQKQYFLRRIQEERVDLRGIIERGTWERGEIIITAIEGLLQEKAEAAIDDLDKLLNKWEDAVRDGNETADITLESIFEKIEQIRNDFPSYFTVEDQTQMLDRILSVIMMCDDIEIFSKYVEQLNNSRVKYFRDLESKCLSQAIKPDMLEEFWSKIQIFDRIDKGIGDRLQIITDISNIKDPNTCNELRIRLQKLIAEEIRIEEQNTDGSILLGKLKNLFAITQNPNKFPCILDGNLQPPPSAPPPPPSAPPPPPPPLSPDASTICQTPFSADISVGDKTGDKSDIKPNIKDVLISQVRGAGKMIRNEAESERKGGITKDE